MKCALTSLLVSAPVLLLAACGEPASGRAAQSATPASPPLVSPASAHAATPPAPAGSNSPVGQAIDQAALPAPGTDAPAMRDALIRAQVLLARAHFSPGVIDGQTGENMTNALMAYEAANGLPQDGVLDEAVWSRLVQGAGPVTADYAITPQDVAGPFTPKVPDDYADMAKLERLAYSGPLEALAEKFHMDERLLQALNPGADFAVAGTKIVVVVPASAPLAKVARVEVDKGRKQVRAYGADEALVATYPASIGSAELPTPSGDWAVRTIAEAPTWTYDPSRLNFGDKRGGKQTIKAGPNNPVGAVWIDLTKDTYGIHGSPDPHLVGKRASHGCVRLTNWDAEELAQAVAKGVPVRFVGGGAAVAKT